MIPSVTNKPLLELTKTTAKVKKRAKKRTKKNNKYELGINRSLIVSGSIKIIIKLKTSQKKIIKMRVIKKFFLRLLTIFLCYNHYDNIAI